MSSGRIRAAAGVAFIALAALALTGAVAATTDRASFTYELGARATGAIQGTCEGRAIVPPIGESGAWSLAAGAAILRFVDVWINYTEVLPETGQPVHHGTDGHRSERFVTLASSPIALSWPSSGLASVSGYGGQTSQAPFHVGFDATTVRVGPTTLGGDRPSDPLREPRGSYVGWSRPIEVAGSPWHVEGDLSVYLEQATVRAAGFQYSMAPYLETQRSGGPGLQFVAEHYRYAWLDLKDASATIPSAGTKALCAGIEATIAGAWSAFGANGYLELGDTRQAFQQRELALEGAFALHDAFDGTGEHQAAPAQATVEGTFDAVGFDLAIPQPVPPRTWPTVAAAAAGGFALTLLGAIILYSRITEDQLLDRPERRRLYEAVMANPGIEFARLLEQNPMSATNARYHLKLLERRGLLRVVNVQGRHRYVASNLDPNLTKRELLLSEDPKLRALLGLLNGEGRPASELVDALRREWGLSRTGGWKVLDRAVRAQLVERLVHERRVILRRAS